MVTVTTKLFGEYPSLKEESICSNGCPIRKKQLRIISLNPKENNSNLTNTIREKIFLKGLTQCRNKKCTGMEQTKVTETGKIHKVYFLFFSISNVKTLINKNSEIKENKKRPK